MSITFIEGQKAYFIDYKGLGICLAWDGEGKLTPAITDSGHTAESLLNKFYNWLNDYVLGLERDLQQLDLVDPIITLASKLAELGQIDDEQLADVKEKLRVTRELGAKELTVGRATLMDVTDFMVEHNLSFKTVGEEVSAEKIKGDVNNILDRFKKSN